MTLRTASWSAARAIVEAALNGDAAAAAQEDGLVVAAAGDDDDAAALWQLQLYGEVATPFAHHTEAIARAAPGLGAALLADLADEDWVALSQAGLPPVAARRFLIHGSHDRAAGRARRNAIEIEAGRAFGTAHHATTRGCLVALDAIVRPGRPIARVLDLGTGSGVLAIAAARLLPRARIVAADIDPVAIGVARANARVNAIASGRIAFVVAAGFAAPAIQRAAPFDLVLANILAAPLILLAKRFAAHLVPGGRVVLSGLLATQAREVTAAFAAVGFRRAMRRDEAGWATLTLRYAP